MIIKIPVIVTPLKEGGYMARCEEIRATATGDTTDGAILNLREAIDEMVKEYGRNEVFQDLMPESQVQVMKRGQANNAIIQTGLTGLPGY
jgi:predicted RNase H-like HicB family nuclease